MEHIELSPSEMYAGALAGIMRQIENLRLGRQSTHGADQNKLWQIHIDGALGELAVAKCLGIYWAGKGEFRGPDVGSVDVRSSPLHTNRLILHPDDPDDRRFYFVTGMYGKYQVHGWCRGEEGKRDEYWMEPPKARAAAFFVPKTALHPL